MRFRTKYLRLAFSCAIVALLSLGGRLSAGRELWVVPATESGVGRGSEAGVFRSLAEALQAAEPGDVITLRAGVYREHVRLPSGAPDRPITIRAAEGERVVVSGMIPVRGWKRQSGQIWTALVDIKPKQLFVCGRPQRLARLPHEGWWKSVAAGRQGGSCYLRDPEHLSSVSSKAPLGEVFVWFKKGNVYGTFGIQQLDCEAGRITFQPQSRWQQPTSGDFYWLQNRPEYLDGPGQWAVTPEGDRYRLWFWPRQKEDLEAVEVPIRQRSLLEGHKVEHLRIIGLEVIGSLRDGIELNGAKDVCVRRCIISDNSRAGISLRGAHNVVVAQNIVRRNRSGVVISYSHNVTIEQNDIGHNHVDGLIVSWRSSDVTVRKNYVHHHLLWGHPDNMQCYRDVSRLLVEDNVLLAAGQSIMLEETRQVTLRGNAIIGSAAYMVIFGHGNAAEAVIERNTLAFSGYGCLSLTAHDYEIRENVFMTGHNKPVYGVRGIKGYRADRNLFFGSARFEGSVIMATDKGWHRDLRAAREATGQDQQSIQADPQFRNAPLLFRVLDHRRLHECTPDRWYLRDGSKGFRVGDIVEVNFDGHPRRVVAVDPAAGSITVDPPLAEKPIKGWLIANWGNTSDLQIDLTLRSDSPGAKLAADGGPVGSRCPIAAYRAGDFDADGHRDLPSMPDWLAASEY